MIKEKLKLLVRDGSTKEGRIFDFTIQFLIVLSLINYAIETIPDLNPEIRYYLHLIDVFIVAVFTIEYILRIIFAENRIKYIFSFFGIIDLIAILPFYLSVGLDMRSVRIFRVFRVFRVFKLTRYNRAISRLNIAFSIAKEEIFLFLMVSAILLYFSAAGIHFFEYEAQPEQFSSLFSSLWWAIGTLTTVGYGDVYPITIGGKIFTFFILIIGLGVVAVPAALLAEGLGQARRIQSMDYDDKK